MKANIVILNYNGEELLPRCLPSIIEAAKQATTPTRITILDNVSTDKSKEVIAPFSEDVTWVDAPKNKVLCSYNDYLKSIDDDIVILMNNDIQVEPDFVDPLMESFKKDSNTFMTVSKTLSSDKTHYEGGKTRFRLKYGIFWASSRYPGYEPLIDEPGLTMAAGYGAVDREKFLELGGYDELYLPGRLEDSDICFRAWRRGWNCVYEPKSIVYHSGAESFHKKFGEKGTLIINHRNSFLFLWKNLRSSWMWIQHLFFLPLRLVFALLRGHVDFVQGFFKALPKLPEAFKKRSQEKGNKSIRTDQEIFDLV